MYRWNVRIDGEYQMVLCMYYGDTTDVGFPHVTVRTPHIGSYRGRVLPLLLRTACTVPEKNQINSQPDTAVRLRFISTGATDSRR